MTCGPDKTVLPVLGQGGASSAPAGRKYWRSLEELADSDELRRWVEREFPSRAGEWTDPISRRNFLVLMGASLALAGASGCSVRPAPATDLVPYTRPPEEVVPGKPLFFATTMSLAGDAVGLLVESHMGRPTKIEGNPDHPASLGATSPLHQASVLGLYDPDRSQTVTYQGRERTWDDAAAAIRGAMQMVADEQGAGLAILTESFNSPTLAAQLEALLKKYPAARWYMHDAVSRDAADEAARMAFDQHVVPRYDFSKADVVLSLDADFLTSGPGHLAYARQFIDRRRVQSQGDPSQAEMNRLYVAESAVGCTGAKADHRLALRSADIELLARALATRLDLPSGGGPALSGHEKWIEAVADDLQAHRGRSLVIAGQRQPAVVHLLAHAINDRLDNVGQTVAYIEPPVSVPGAERTLADLAAQMEQGEIEFLLILGGNPAFTAPADVPFVKWLDRVPLRVHLSLYQDETSRLCQWHLPEVHYLEAWSDARAFDGTASIAQPLVEPLYQGRSAHEVVAFLSELVEVPGRDLVRDFWRRRWDVDAASAEFERRWQTALHDGVVADTALAATSVSLAGDWQRHLASGRDESSAAARYDSETLELNFLADPSINDGRFANNGWLQELPKPVTKLTWGNAAIVSPATAKKLGLSMGSYAHGGEHGGYHMPTVKLQLGDRTVLGPLWIMPGHADGTVTVYLGGGRRSAGRVGGTSTSTVGFDVYPLRTSDRPWFVEGLGVSAVTGTTLVACTQQHHSMDGRDVVRSATLAHFKQHPKFVHDAIERERRDRAPAVDEPLTMYESFDYEAPKPKWGMAIDLTACIGCNACIVACQAENNIPVVGKEQVAAGREMHWLRVDRYIGGPADAPDEFHFQPLPCMHCENAPCEYVCPVEATVHSDEGLNDMVYNRCVGTRFCSNNCPYKVRRFNFLAYADFKTESLRLQYNPDVTVRSRGVMEKCTYCVQRIRHAEIDAQVEARPIADGEVLTACQAACPTRAIEFGNINDPQSAVKAWKHSPLDYGLLEDLNTVPRTSYLAELRNPNPALEGDAT